MMDKTKTLDDLDLDKAARALDKLRKTLIVLKNEGAKEDNKFVLEMTAEELEETRNALLTGISGVIYMDTVNANIRKMNETTTDPFEDDMK